MKPLTDPEKTQASLLVLRNELLEKWYPTLDDHPDIKEILWKINSCLYSEYPRK
jgi:hypothetical protein